MGTRVSPERRIYESARDRDLEGVFSGLMLLVAEALYRGDEMPPYTIPALRQWVSLERGRLQHGPPEIDTTAAQDIEEMSAVLALLSGGEDG